MTGLPALSPEMCSRLAKGYPILFNHLTPVDLEEIARLAIDELSVEFETQLGLRIVPPDDRLITLMVLRLGPDLDARTLTSGIPLMIKDAFRDVLTERRDDLFKDADTFDRVRTLALDLPSGPEREYFKKLHQGGRKVMMVSDRPLLEQISDCFGEFQWSFSADGAAAVEALDSYNLVCVHVEAPDEAGHNADAAGKVAAISEIDKHIVGPVLKRLQSEGDDWRILPEGYPADKQAVDRMLDTISGLRLTALASSSKNYTVYDLDEAKRLQVTASKGDDLLLSVGVGKAARFSRTRRTEFV
jgi:hypothetical protein